MQFLKKMEWLSLIGLNISLAVIYLISGFVGLLTAAPPGYATVIWPPSGIALAAVLIWGFRLLPAIYICSFLVNLYQLLQHDQSLLVPKTIVLAMILGIGTVLQVIAGRLLIERWVGVNNRLDTPKDILLFSLLSGPIACLISATWSNGVLFAAGILPSHVIAFNWTTWWVGSSMGVLIFTPIFLILFGKPAEVWRARIVPILLPLCISFVFVIGVYGFINHSTFYPIEAWSSLAMGLLFCVLINIILFAIHGQRNSIQIKLHEKDMAIDEGETSNLLLLQYAGDGIYGLDQEGKVSFINPAACQMLGYEADELLGKDMHAMVHHSYPNGEAYPEEECPVCKCLKGKKSNRILSEVYWRKDGSSFWVEYTSMPIIKGHKIMGAVVIFKDISDRHEAEVKLKTMAHVDSLTQLPNRLSFVENLQKALARSKQTKTLTAACFIDVDNFKHVNDTLGHSFGDELLKVIPSFIKPVLREQDFLARLGGDEFALIISDVNTVEDIEKILKSYMQSVNQVFKLNGSEISTSVSIGVALFPESGTTTEELIKNADIAMYRAKELGKNVFVFYDRLIHQLIERRHQIELHLRHAIENNEFSVVYQPQINAKTEKLVGVEVLLRWFNPTLGGVSPYEFIPIAEECGYINKIGLWVLETACNDYQAISQQLNNKDLILSINVSMKEMERNGYFEAIEQIFEKTNINKSIIMLELTESALMKDPARTMLVIQSLSLLGIQFALDDFGVGYSSMRYLKDLAITTLKIDKSFIDEMVDNPSNAVIVKAIVQLAHTLGIKTIAEGVETKEQLMLLKALSCEQIQGYYFAKPMPLDELIKCCKERF